MRAVEGYYRRKDEFGNPIQAEYHQPSTANRIRQIVELGPQSGIDYISTDFSTYSTPLIEAIRRGKHIFKINFNLHKL